jgi:hypothetical protein
MSPAINENERTLFCIAWSIKKGETPASYSAEAAKLAEALPEEDLKKYCESPAGEPGKRYQSAVEGE